MNDYRFMQFPGKKFQKRMTTDTNTIKKLSNTLNMYTGYNNTPIYMRTLLKARFQENEFYKIFIGITILCTLAFLLISKISSWILLAGIICMSLIGMFIIIFYTEAADYKMLNTLIANSAPEDIIRYSKKLNEALQNEKKSPTKNK